MFRQRSRPRFAAAILTAVAALLATACGSAGDSEGGAGPTKVRFGVAVSAITTSYAPMTSVPDTLGYWRDENLEVEILGFDGGAAMLQALEAGQIDMGNAGTGSWYPFVQRGADVHAVCQHLTGFIHIPMVVASSPIRTVADLRGKSIAVASLEASQIPMLKGMLLASGIQPDEVNFVPLKPGPEAVAAYRDGLFDVFGYWDEPHAQIATILGEELRPLEIPPAYSSLSFSGSFYASGEFLQDNRDAVLRVLRAYAKGAEFSRHNPEAAVRIHHQKFPETVRSGVPPEQGVQLDLSVFRARQQNTEPVDNQWCNTPRQGVAQLMNVLLQTGVIDEPIDIDGHWTNEFTPEVNRFDRAAVQRDAETWVPR